MKYKIIKVTKFKQNCSLIWCERTLEAAIIDPGGEISLLINEIDFSNVNIKKILLTHGHLDHVGAAKVLALHYKIPIIGPHLADKILLNNIDQQCEMFGVEKIIPFMPDHWLIDGEIIIVGDEIFSILYCPGHSPGHVIFLHKKEKFIFMGDVLFRGSIGRTDLPGGNIKTLMRSIKNKLLPLSDDISFIPGHGPMSTLYHEKNTNPFLRLLTNNLK